MTKFDDYDAWQAHDYAQADDEQDAAMDAAFGDDEQDAIELERLNQVLEDPDFRTWLEQEWLDAEFEKDEP